jgi:hypothetical protein
MKNVSAGGFTKLFFGAGLAGHVTATRAQLTELLGEPNTEGSEDGKVTTQWYLTFPNGSVATLYDYKRYELGAPAMHEMCVWHIGARTQMGVDALLKELATLQQSDNR